jgi:protoporphyrin/coproporphyrin ferrochelatase
MNKGIILMNLGSPDTTEVKDVRKYLSEFLMDERVIDIPYLLRLLLVRGIIAPTRAARSAKAYKKIWWKEGSPLVTLTNQLQAAVQQNFDIPVTVAMRYGTPSAKDAYEDLLRQNPNLEEVVLMPLYPHYAMSSYETAVEHMKTVHLKSKYAFALKTVQPFYNNTDYIQAFAAHIKPYLQKGFDHLLFSFHGIPERHIKKSDTTKQHCLQVENCCSVDSAAHATCYKHQCLVTANLTAAALGLPKEKYSHSFQSRLGRDPWLKPYTDFRLKDMPGEGIKKLLIICPAFVSDCLETLEEIAMEGKETFMEAGGESYEMIPCLNLDPMWVQAVTKLIHTQLDEEVAVNNESKLQAVN